MVVNVSCEKCVKFFSRRFLRTTQKTHTEKGRKNTKQRKTVLNTRTHTSMKKNNGSSLSKREKQ